MQEPVMTWHKTKVQNLVRHKSGRYYAGAFKKSKEIWKSFGTLLLGLAKARLADFMGERREAVSASEGVTLGALTLGQCLALYLAKVDADHWHSATKVKSERSLLVSLGSEATAVRSLSSSCKPC